jgi:hypothetical protein
LTNAVGRTDTYVSFFMFLCTATVHVSTLRKLVLPDACEHLAQHESVIRSYC